MAQDNEPCRKKARMSIHIIKPALETLPAMLRTASILTISVVSIVVVACEPQSTDKTKVERTLPKEPLPEISTWNDTNSYLQNVIDIKVLPLSDTSFCFKWGNKTFQSQSQPFPNSLFNYHPLQLAWTSESYVALYLDTGSDTWLHVIFPLKASSEVRVYGNPLAYDKASDIVVFENYFGIGDTILIAENIKSGQRQFILNSGTACASAINHYCIDSIHINNRHLYLEWFPETGGKGKKTIFNIPLNL